MIKLRAFYLATGLSGGILIPYLAVILENDGFQSGMVGLVMAIGTFVSLFMQPIWGILVDKYRMTRATLAMSTMIPGLIAIFFNLHVILLIVAAISIYNVFSAPQGPISDAYAVTSAERSGASYGSIRLFGSIGFGLGGFASSFYLAHFPLTTLWIPYVSLSLLGSAIALLFPQDSPKFAKRPRMRDGAKHLLTHPPFLFFLAGVFLVSQTLTSFNSYFALAFKGIGGSISLVGLTFFIASASNIPVMMFARRVSDRFGLVPTMLFATIIYIIRWLSQTLFPFPWVVVSVQVLHGLSFGLFYVSAVAFVSKTASEETQATGQSIFGICCNGIAGIVGNLLNGYLLRYGGPDVMYLSCTISAAMGTACFVIVGRLNRKHGSLVSNL